MKDELKIRELTGEGVMGCFSAYERGYNNHE